MSNPLALDNLGATALVFDPLVGSVLAENRRFGGDFRRCYTDRAYWRLQAWQLAGLGSAVLFAQEVPDATSRDPSAILMLAGVGLGLGNALGLAACVVLAATGYIQRIPREEALLRRELGEPYTEYASKRRRLVPGVY